MTREHKLALILGFALVLVVGVLVSDHFSKARSVALGPTADPEGVVLTEDQSISHDLVETPLDDPTLGWIDEPLQEIGPSQGLAQLNAMTPIVEPPPVASEIVMGELPPSFGADPLLEGQVPFQATRGPELAISDPVLEDPTPTRDLTVSARAHTVARSETLWGIAETYYGNGMKWKDLARVNASVVGKDGTVRQGDVLTIPARARLADAAPAARVSERRPTRQSPTKKVAPPASSQTTYTVKAADDLGSIARKLLGSATKWPKIYELNKSKIKDPDVLQVGLTLAIPAR